MIVLWYTDELMALRCPVCDDFKEGGKPEYSEKNPRSTGEINCRNSLTWNVTHKAWLHRFEASEMNITGTLPPLLLMAKS